MDLYVKAGPDGKSVGDCPFAHYVRMVLKLKGVGDVNLHPLPNDPKAKPEWLVQEFDGKMPCLVREGKKIGDSSNIATYLEETFPDPPLLSGFHPPALEAAKKATDGIFPAAARLIKATNEDDRVIAETALIKVLEQFEEFWNSRSDPKGRFLASDDQMCLLDCSVAPKLFHLDVALAHFHPESHAKVKEMFPGLAAYAQTVFDQDAFKDTAYPKGTVVWGWTTARQRNSGCAV